MSTSITIGAGWWLLPLIITLAAFSWAEYHQPERTRITYLPDPVARMFGVGLYLVATIVSLVAWLIWLIAA